jgi:RNA polymerase sigma factor (sigma-70 family)
MATTRGEQEQMEPEIARLTRQDSRERRFQDWVEECVRLARTGDPGAWSEIVRRFEDMLRAVARGHRLSNADAADVVQTTWLRLAENLDRLQDPSRVGAWLATTARRECLRTVRQLARELPADHPPEPPHSGVAPVDRRLLQADRDAALWSAFGRLPRRDQKLLRMLVADPQPSYEEIGTTLAMPIGSIGPTRGRALQRLRRGLELNEGLDDLAA